MRVLPRLVGAFLKRDLLEVSPWGRLLQFFGVIPILLFWFLLAGWLQGRVAVSMTQGMDYFTYSLIGLAFTQYAWRGFSSFSDRLKRQQSSGLLGSLAITPHDLPCLVVLSGAGDYLAVTLEVAVILLVGTYGMGAHLSGIEILRILGIGLLASLGMSSLGLLLSSWNLVFGETQVLRFLLAQAIPLLSGAFFPVAVLPHWAHRFSWTLPLTYGLNLARATVRPPPGGITLQLWLPLLAITGCLTAASWAALRRALKHARATGSLGWG